VIRFFCVVGCGVMCCVVWYGSGVSLFFWF